MNTRNAERALSHILSKRYDLKIRVELKPKERKRGKRT